MENNQQLATMANEQHSMSVFTNTANFENAQRVAKLLASSDLVPTQYKGNVANTLIALEMSNRMGASPLAVMQNLNIIHGKPSFGSSFIIATINTCGRFAPLKFKVEGEGDNRSCIAYTNDAQGNPCEGPAVSIKMAKAEGWWSKKDKSGRETSKWQTMPDLMLRYRAAAFFGRLYCPEIIMGMHSSEEVIDANQSAQPLHSATQEVPVTPSIESINSKLKGDTEDQPTVVVEATAQAATQDDELM